MSMSIYTAHYHTVPL